MIIIDPEDTIRDTGLPSFDDVYNHNRTGYKTPVFYDPDPQSAGWYWCDEVWGDHGPYQTKEEATKDLNDYVEKYL